jgi:integrase
MNASNNNFEEFINFENNLSDFWTTLEKYNILDRDSALEKFMSAKREKIKKLHPYAITPPSKEGGRWQTCYRTPNGTRKNIKAPTEEQLLDKLLPVYAPYLNNDNKSFYELYQEWLAYKSTVTNSPNTITRHGQHYKKYFESSCLHSMKIGSIDELKLEEECNRIIKDFNLPRKEWTNVKTILLGMFEYAVRKKYLSVNPMDKVKILVKFRQVVHKTGKTETYNTDELTTLNQYLDRMYQETHDTAFIAVKLNFMLGLRVGELVALKWEDYHDLNHLHIVREEVKNRETNQYNIVDHTKTNRDRYVALVPNAVSLLQKVDRTGEYIFMRGAKRITSRQIAYILEKYAERQGVSTKSTHKMRKTYASKLNAAGFLLIISENSLGIPTLVQLSHISITL